MIDRKIREIQNHFVALMGERITRYETAELLLDDGTWGIWPDLPIRLYTESNKFVSISWSNFDDLWLAGDRSLLPPISRRGFDDQMGQRWHRGDQRRRRCIDPIGDARARRHVD